MRLAWVSLVLGVLCAGCATTSSGPVPSLREAESPAWSLATRNQDMIVSVSPARQTLQMAGTTGLILGAGISAVSNARHRRAVDDILEGYDAGAEFEQHLRSRLEDVVGPSLVEVPPLGSVVGHKQRREAEKERFRAVRRQGHTLLLDLDLSCGIFGTGGTLVAKLEGEMRSMPRADKVWTGTLVVTSEEVLANDRLTDPTKRMGPDLRAPRLTVQDGAIAQWTEDGGTLLRTRMTAAIEGAVSALLTELGLTEEAQGFYHLGCDAMNRKRFEEAHEYFQRGLAQAPGDAHLRNAMAVNLAHNGQLEAALRLALELAQEQPDYAPAAYNLAWWYAVELGDAEAARPHYERALSLGMAPERKIERSLERNA